MTTSGPAGHPSRTVDGVTVSREPLEAEYSFPAISYTLRSHRDVTVSLVLREVLPDELDPRALRFHPGYAGDSWRVTENAAVFEYQLGPGESVETLCGVPEATSITTDVCLDDPLELLVDPPAPDGTDTPEDTPPAERGDDRAAATAPTATDEAVGDDRTETAAESLPGGRDSPEAGAAIEGTESSAPAPSAGTEETGTEETGTESAGTDESVTGSGQTDVTARDAVAAAQTAMDVSEVDGRPPESPKAERTVSESAGAEETAREAEEPEELADTVEALEAWREELRNTLA